MVEVDNQQTGRDDGVGKRNTVTDGHDETTEM
jgi:hypothetical protein